MKVWDLKKKVSKCCNASFDNIWNFSNIEHRCSCCGKFAKVRPSKNIHPLEIGFLQKDLKNEE